MTARWVVDVVQPEREFDITWQPISLLVKNEPPEGTDYHRASEFTHNLLRVFESVKATEGMEAAQKLYWHYGAVIHHDRVDGTVDIADVFAGGALPFLEAAGIDTSHAAAFDDESWDAVIKEKMDAGLALVGDDVGTPIIAFDSPAGRKGIFGPVITRTPQGEDAQKLWDAMVTMATMDGFWELKRTRTEEPDFGPRPV